MKNVSFVRSLAIVGLLATSALAQSAPPASFSDVPDRFQIDTGYFRLSANTVLRYQGPSGGAGQVDFESDLGQSEQDDTFWVDGTWRVGRRHQVKLGVTSIRRDRDQYTLQRPFEWGGETYEVGLQASSKTGTDLLGGYYRFALVRNDRFEIGPAVGVGYLWLDASIEATGTVGGQSRTRSAATTTGSITGAVGGYASGWLTRRLVAQADFLYIKVSPDDGEEASVTDWRVALDYYIFRNAGLGVQYKYNRYSLEKGARSTELSGELIFKGFQIFATFRF